MTVEEGRRFLEGEGLLFVELHFDKEQCYWSDVLSCAVPDDRGREGPVTVLRIEAPNGRRHLDLQFLKGEFLDLWFGGWSFELFDTKEKYLEEELRAGIRAVMAEGYICTICTDLKHDRCRWDSLVDPEEDGSMEKRLEKLRRPKTLFELLFRTRRLYEVCDWNEYYRIER